MIALLRPLLFAISLLAVSGRPSAFDPGEWSFPADSEGSIEASVFSLPSTFFDPGTAVRHLAEVRALGPNRTIVALVDEAMNQAIRPEAKRLRVTLVPVESGYTPWPRDTFSFLRGPGGRVRILTRPASALQEGREPDNAMGRELAERLPPSLARAWRDPRWSESPVPFHNGQVLLTPDTAWISLHTLEPRILAMLRLERVPVESFSSSEGVARYADAARSAAKELERLYRRKTRFVHPMPDAATRHATGLMTSIGGGAGFDLDSLVTVVRGRSGKTEAFVADLREGARLLSTAPASDFEVLRKGYALSPPAEELRSALLSQLELPRPARLRGYLDLVAANFADLGISVRRLPLLFVPTGLLADHSGLQNEDFLITWNNVVVECSRSTRRAEGFSAGFPAGDARAVALFADASYRLDLLPPLVKSIVLNGGYRCASNHLRRP